LTYKNIAGKPPCEFFILCSVLKVQMQTCVARWSSGQDGGLSRPNREFDSPSGHHFYEHH
jgi:hypothetical protein